MVIKLAIFLSIIFSWISLVFVLIFSIFIIRFIIYQLRQLIYIVGTFQNIFTMISLFGIFDFMILVFLNVKLRQGDIFLIITAQKWAPYYVNYQTDLISNILSAQAQERGSILDRNYIPYHQYRDLFLGGQSCFQVFSKDFKSCAQTCSR